MSDIINFKLGFWNYLQFFFNMDYYNYEIWLWLGISKFPITVCRWTAKGHCKQAWEIAINLQTEWAIMQIHHEYQLLKMIDFAITHISDGPSPNILGTSLLLFNIHPSKKVTQHDFDRLYFFYPGFLFIRFDIRRKPVYLPFEWCLIC